MGMTYDEFWLKRPTLVMAYRKANELRNERINQEMWWNGAYTFNALMTTLSNFHLDGKHHQINNYLEKPFSLKPEKTNEELERERIVNLLNRFAEGWHKKHG